MLDRPRPSPRAAWQRNWRRRAREGSRVTEVPRVMIELLIASKWLEPREAEDRAAITAALDGFARAARPNKYC
jgi:hypothetical protein